MSRIIFVANGLSVPVTLNTNSVFTLSEVRSKKYESKRSVYVNVTLILLPFVLFNNNHILMKFSCLLKGN